ncbi:hypothetical protein [Daejeonella sp. H1SJ63]|uniref:hypothetical protein n=1 Tax=Daejeonella sp. H1SJ63 TaxID=3034145 RepID=UPI0023EB85BB|nr:hypothetical protein [Daejeonella sp. H1SJ63]
MRTLIFKLLILLTLIILSSCSTRKLNRQKAESSASAQSETLTQENHLARYDAKHILQMSDSTHELYTIHIIPADTFSFSLQHGFRGKAEKIEISGLRRKVKTLTDSTGIQAEQQSSQSYEEHQQSEKHDSAKSRVLENKSRRVMWLLIGLFGIILLGWWLKRWIRSMLG